MKDINDKQTLPLIPEKRGRGRPKSGEAMTRAQIQKAYRERKNSNSTEKMHQAVAEDLRAELAKAISRIEELEKLLQEKEAKGNVTQKKTYYEVQIMPKGTRKWSRTATTDIYLSKERADRQLHRYTQEKPDAKLRVQKI